MICEGGINRYASQPLDQQAFLASLIMSDDNTEQPVNKKSPSSIKDDWGSSLRSSRKSLFEKTEFDIFCDRELGETFIFYGKELPCTIDFLEYNPENQRVTVFTNDGQQLDLGARIQWLIRPYFAKPQIIVMARTKNGKVVEGFEVRLKVKTPETKTVN